MGNKLIVVLFFLAVDIAVGQVEKVPLTIDVDWDAMANTHDISLSPWGPYSKRYAGISHLHDLTTGMRFDFSVLPGFYRNKMLVPNVLMESGYYPWESNAEMTEYTYRYELEWKDNVYVDVTYSIIDSNLVMVKMDCVNNTDIAQNLDLNLMGFIDYPDDYADKKIVVADGSLWRNAVDYSTIGFIKKRPTDNLVHLGWNLGEVRSSDHVGSSALGRNFGSIRGDSVTYVADIDVQRRDGTLSFLYRMDKNETVTFQLKGLINQAVTFNGTGKLEWMHLPYVLPEAGKYELTLISEGGSGMILNGFCLTPSTKDLPKTTPTERHVEPILFEKDTAARTLILKYKDIDTYYGIRWESAAYTIREVKHDELDIFFRKFVHNHTSSTFKGNEAGHFTNVFIRPVVLRPNSREAVYAVLCSGRKSTVQTRLTRLKDLEAAYNTRPGSTSSRLVSSTEILPEGRKYAFSVKMLQATLLNNVVYPIYTQRSYIRHYAPGKWWNILYTWDAGFIASGLAAIDPDKAVEYINTYTTTPGSQSAFIHHGSPVPTQFYAFYDLWNKTQSKEMLRYFYPRLKQYYAFLAGSYGSSTTRMKSGLLKTWDYFYNSGGWDDYPPQVALHQEKREKTIAPVSNTAHCIRIAKILRLFADELDINQDLVDYDSDIAVFTKALQRYAWNPASGYFSYVVHNNEEKAIGKYLHESGKDFNMGLDGAYPVFSGSCTEEQQQILLKKLFSEKYMWTPTGLCVVDQSAPYYTGDGYWNGAVWMPHQWLMWKAMLDIGRTDLAYRIVNKALEVYSKETQTTYYTFEHFMAETGRGAGWHQFSGLSSPILAWFSSYYIPGTVSTGFEVFIQKQRLNADKTNYSADIVFDNSTDAHTRSMVVCLNPAHRYRAEFNGKEIDVVNRYNGLIELTFPPSNSRGRLAISIDGL